MKTNLVISVIGFGNIGKFITGLLVLNKDFGFQINIMDTDWKVLGAILDFRHGAQLFPNHEISYNSEKLLNSSDFIFHCAGASVPKGKSRLVTCKASIEITETIFNKFKPSKAPFIIVVANPVEIISHITQKITGLPKQNVIGTGTYLDSTRMNYLIESTNKDITSVNSIILGEHGTTAFLSEQLSTINGHPFNSVFDQDTIEELLNSVKASAAEIKKTQVATIYGVSYCAHRIFESLLTEDSQTYPVSTCLIDNLKGVLGNTEIYLSLLSEVNNAGAQPISSYHPSGEELAQLQKSVDLIIPCIPRKYL